MFSTTAPHLSPADLACQQAEDAQCFRRMLHGPIDQGADLARVVHGTATAQAGVESEADAPAAMTLPEATVAFDRCARAVRPTVALARHVAQPLPARGGGRHPARGGGRGRGDA